MLTQRFRDAVARLNPELPAEALEDAFRRLTRPEGPDLIQRNRALHRRAVNGVTVEYRTSDGAIRGAQARVIDFDDPANNDLLAVGQFTVTENKHTRRPDVVPFINGLPLAVLELKNAADEDATIGTAFQQLQTYQAEIPSLFATNAMLVVSDGLEARVGALGAGREWFKPRRTIAGEGLADTDMPEIQVVIEGVFAPRRFLDLGRDFIVFEDDGSGRVIKKMAGYHQFHAVGVAVAETRRAGELARADRVAEETGRYEAGRKPGGKPGDRRIGVIWQTQGSGKSLTMAFYAGRIIREPAMEDPTIVVLTDRNDLDDQLFGTFSRCQDLLRQPPVKAESRAPAAVAVGAGRRRGLHDDPEVLPGGEGRPPPHTLRTREHRGDRRRGAPHPVRVHRRLRAPHARGAAARLVQLEAVVGAEERLRLLAQDIVEHFERRLAKRFREPADPFRIVIVRDMWLTGFDAPGLHTMYVDKPMRGHGLMQAIAQVNRVFRDKPGGLVVDYLGLAHDLKTALAAYTESGGEGQTAISQDEAVAVMREKYEICCDLFYGFDWSRWTTGTPQERLSLLPAAQEHILAQENGKERCIEGVGDLSEAFALAVPHEEALAIRDDVAFFQAVRAALAKRVPSEARPQEELDHAIRQIVSRASRAVAPEIEWRSSGKSYIAHDVE